MTEENSTMESPKPDLENFDFLRLSLATMVVLFHVGLLSHVTALSWLCKYISATFAVQGFFVVSGFLVWLSYERSHSIKEYWGKRVRRILPAYVVVVIASVLLLSFSSSLSTRTYFSSAATWQYCLKNLLFANFAAPNLPGVFENNWEKAVNGSLWTIKIELMFYASVPIIYALASRFGSVKTVSTIFVISVLWRIAFYILSRSDTDIFSKLGKQLPGQLCFFCGGILTYVRWKQRRDYANLAFPAICTACYMFMPAGLLSEATSALCVTGIVQFIVNARLLLPKTRQIGDVSYGIYLYHFPIVQTFVSRGAFAGHPFVSLAEVMVATSAVAFCSWRLIEKPFLGHRLPKPP